MGLSAHIRKHAFSIPGKLQLVHMAFAKALEIIPRQICDNAGIDSTDILNKLRMRHANGHIWFGVDVDGPEGVRDNMEAFVWEPSLVKINAINSATEGASLILSVDETVRNPQSESVSVHLYVLELFPLTAVLLLSSPLQDQPCHRAPLRKR
jgi:T-complex protein 1 subunit eta